MLINLKVKKLYLKRLTGGETVGGLPSSETNKFAVMK